MPLSSLHTLLRDSDIVGCGLDTGTKFKSAFRCWIGKADEVTLLLFWTNISPFLKQILTKQDSGLLEIGNLLMINWHMVLFFQLILCVVYNRRHKKWELLCFVVVLNPDFYSLDAQCNFQNFLNSTLES